MPPPRPATEARSGSLEPGRPSRAQLANTRHPAGRPHTPPADWMYATDVRQTDVRQHHRLMPPGPGITNTDREANSGLQWPVCLAYYKPTTSGPSAIVYNKIL